MDARLAHLARHVNQNGLALRFVKPEWKTLELVLAAVKKNGLALQYAPDHMKNDMDVVLAAVNQTDHALKYVLSIDIVWEFLEKNPWWLEYASKEMVIQFVDYDGLWLQYAFDDMKYDKDVVAPILEKANANGSSGEALALVPPCMRYTEDVTTPPCTPPCKRRKKLRL